MFKPLLWAPPEALSSICSRPDSRIFILSSKWFYLFSFLEIRCPKLSVRQVRNSGSKYLWRPVNEILLILHIFMSRWLYYGSYWTPHSFESSNVSAQWRMGRSSSSMPWQAFSAFCLRFLLKLEGFSYDLEMKTREQNRNNKRSKVERFGWFIERIKTRLAFCWLSERSGQKNLMPENF